MKRILLRFLVWFSLAGNWFALLGRVCLENSAISSVKAQRFPSRDHREQKGEHGEVEKANTERQG
jgi:hypothetical protein